MTGLRARSTLGEPMLAVLAAASVLAVAGATLFSLELLQLPTAGASSPASLDRLAAATRL